MKAIRIERNGGPEVMALADVVALEPGANEVRVRNHAIGGNTRRA